MIWCRRERDVETQCAVRSRKYRCIWKACSAPRLVSSHEMRTRINTRNAPVTPPIFFKDMRFCHRILLSEIAIHSLRAATIGKQR